MDAAAPAPALGYAPPASWHRRRRTRLIAAALLLLTFASAGFLAWKRYGPWLQKRSAMLSAQRACLDYAPPPGSVVFQQDADATYESGVRVQDIRAFAALSTRRGRRQAPRRPGRPNLRPQNLRSQTQTPGLR